MAVLPPLVLIVGFVVIVLLTLLCLASVVKSSIVASLPDDGVDSSHPETQPDARPHHGHDGSPPAAAAAAAEAAAVDVSSLYPSKLARTIKYSRLAVGFPTSLAVSHIHTFPAYAPVYLCSNRWRIECLHRNKVTAFRICHIHRRSVAVSGPVRVSYTDGTRVDDVCAGGLMGVSAQVLTTVVLVAVAVLFSRQYVPTWIGLAWASPSVSLCLTPASKQAAFMDQVRGRDTARLMPGGSCPRCPYGCCY